MGHNILVVFLVSILCFIPIGSCEEVPDMEYYCLQPGDKLPEFSVVCNDGSTLTTEMLRGKGSVIVFFSTTCPDCQKTLPEIQKAYEESLASGSNEYRYICISREEDEESVSEYWEKNHFTLPYSAQTTRDVFLLFTNYGVPHIFVSNSDLIIQNVYE